jgi:hypothetical protein
MFPSPLIAAPVMCIQHLFSGHILMIKRSIRRLHFIPSPKSRWNTRRWRVTQLDQYLLRSVGY